MKNCTLCRLSKACNGLPGICILLQFAAVGLMIAMLVYLFVTQELLP